MNDADSRERKLSDEVAKLLKFKQSENVLDYGEVDPMPTVITNHGVEMLPYQWQPAYDTPIGLRQAIQLATDFKLVLDLGNIVAIYPYGNITIQDETIQLAIVKLIIVLLKNQQAGIT
jgi:hypothetical protein